MAAAAAAEEEIVLMNRVAEVLKQMVPLLPTYGHLIVSAVFPIYAASHASLVRPLSAARPSRPTKSETGREEEEQEEKSAIIENLSPGDALLFPLLAGCTLASLYFILKWLQDPQWLNTFLSIYFSWIGLFFLFKFLRDGLSTIRSFIFPNTYSSSSLVWTAKPSKRVYTTTTSSLPELETSSPLPGLLRHIPLGRRLTCLIWTVRNLISTTPAVLHLHIARILTLDTIITIIDPVALVLSCAVVGFHTFIAKPWYLTNLLGFSFCYSALQFTTPTTGMTGTLILGALFVYDIFFVFYTPMMVTVATKLDVPIKLLFPQPHGCVLPPQGSPDDSALVQAYRACLAKKRAMAMLGLGDIVVPGMMIAFALRFDLFLHYSKLACTRTRTRTNKPSSAGSPSTDSSKPEEAETETEIVKAEYKSATGAWGERFWTNKTAWSEQLKAKSFRKPYFHATLVGYVAGLVVTLVALQIMKRGQPALLYLVPGVVGMFWGTALVRGELKALWNYSEDDQEKEEEETEQKDDKKKPKKETKKEDDEKDSKGKEDISSTARAAVVADSKDQDQDHDQGQEKDANKLVDFSITLIPRANTAAAASSSSTVIKKDSLESNSWSADKSLEAHDT